MRKLATLASALALAACTVPFDEAAERASCGKLEGTARAVYGTQERLDAAVERCLARRRAAPPQPTEFTRGFVQGLTAPRACFYNISNRLACQRAGWL
jgi:hypothetical protein